MNSNIVFLSGRLGRDPEFRDSGDVPRALLNIATKDSYKSHKTGGEWVETTDWHRAVAFRKMAERCRDLAKGDKVVIVGKLRTRSYEKGSEKRYVTEVIVNRLDSFVRPAEPRAEPDSDLPF